MLRDGADQLRDPAHIPFSLASDRDEVRFRVKLQALEQIRLAPSQLVVDQLFRLEVVAHREDAGEILQDRPHAVLFDVLDPHRADLGRWARGSGARRVLDHETGPAPTKLNELISVVAEEPHALETRQVKQWLEAAVPDDAAPQLEHLELVETAKERDRRNASDAGDRSEADLE